MNLTIKVYQQNKAGKETASLRISANASNAMKRIAGFIYDYGTIKKEAAKEGHHVGRGQRQGKWFFHASNGRKVTPEQVESLGLAIRFKDDCKKEDIEKMAKRVDYLVRTYLA